MDNLKPHIISALNTFITVFIVTFSTMIVNTIVIDYSILLAITISAWVTWLRAASRFLIEKLK